MFKFNALPKNNTLTFVMITVLVVILILVLAKHNRLDWWQSPVEGYLDTTEKPS